MAVSRTHRLLYRTAVIALCVAGAAHAAQLADPTQPIEMKAASLAFDYASNLSVYTNIRISQGRISVEADQAQATGADFENSQWTFKGNVQILLPDGRLDSETATVTFKNNVIAQAVITGGPASFEQRRSEPEQLARGKAGRIDYDVARNTVRLSEQAWLSDGKSEINGQTLVYDIARQRVVANPGEQSGRGVSITIAPKNGNGDSTSTPARPDASDKRP